MQRRPIMVMGCSSDAGKSFLATALCRHASNRGLRVAPFKALNMSNNAAVTRTGDELARAQALQATAARVEPDARMNPVLLKPSADTFSQVIVLGHYDQELTHTPWLERKPMLWPHVTAALEELRARHDLLVIEGAGSPAEINLRDSDVVNMSVALACEADVYLASDIDRGGSFAHLLGTYEALEPEERARLRGFVLNRFRGDPALLGDAPRWLEERTGVPVVALVPYTRHRLPEEDTLRHRAVPVPGDINLALVAYPWASNLDEFDALVHENGVTVVPLRERRSLLGFDAVILPGSKNAVGSLRTLRETGLAEEIERAAAAGVPVLGVCGGMQMLGRVIRDPHGLESGDAEGLGLLDLETTLAPEKTTRRTSIESLALGTLEGYEIHHGITEPSAGASDQAPYLAEGAGWARGSVRGVYLHGLAENTHWRQAFLAELGWRGVAGDWHAQLDAEIERVAALVESSGWSQHLGL